jgi:hypothetical protein
MPHVSRLEQIVLEATDWSNRVERCLKDPHNPYLSDLCHLLEESNSLPVSLSATSLIEMKIESVNDWTMRLSKLFISTKQSKACIDNTVDSTIILQVILILYEIKYEK